jgi:hypothetical protein
MGGTACFVIGKNTGIGIGKNTYCVPFRAFQGFKWTPAFLPRRIRCGERGDDGLFELAILG